MNNKYLEESSACLIVDSEMIARWQFEALKLAIERGLSVRCVYVCDNTIVRRKYFKHAGYYALNLFSMRHRWAKKVSWRGLIKPEIPVHHFKSDWVDGWQRLRGDTLHEMSGYKFDFVIKFGMYLLRDPNKIPATYGVFSFHHGDPSQYRGRPAGFYELMNGASHIGVMVQRLSNELDAGIVMAFCTCKISQHSYQSTLENAYRNGSFLLSKALKNALDGKFLPHPTSGPNYRLPNNWVVLKFVILLAVRKMRRLFYGAFIEKKWRIAHSVNIDMGALSSVMYLPVKEVIPIPSGYAFLADPIVFDDQTLLCEAMERSSGKGRIIAVSIDGVVRLDTASLGGGHFSYPFLARIGGGVYLLPEMSEMGPQLLATLTNELKIDQAAFLKGLEDERIKDPTLFNYDGRWWLFAGKQEASADMLFLWSSECIQGPYEEHPESPIVMDPSCARPAGPIVEFNGELFRPGQDNRGSYGNGITICKISQLSSERYREECVAEIRVKNAFGPHTLGIKLNSTVIDFYEEKLNPLAWLSRLKNKIGKL
jgi:hypothetical protein